MKAQRQSKKSRKELTIRQLQKIAYQNAKSKGFWSKKSKPFPEKKLLLIISEVVEIMEDIRGGKPKKYYEPKPDGRKKPCGEASEAADVFIRLLDYCEARKIDLYAETIEKMNYNATRAKMHGKKY